MQKKGLNFAGDTGADINKQLGEKLSIKGGASADLTDNNIGVVSNGTDTLNIKLAKTLTGLDSVTAGGPVARSPPPRTRIKASCFIRWILLPE